MERLKKTIWLIIHLRKFEVEDFSYKKNCYREVFKIDQRRRGSETVGFKRIHNRGSCRQRIFRRGILFTNNQWNEYIGCTCKSACKSYASTILKSLDTIKKKIIRSLVCKNSKLASLLLGKTDIKGVECLQRAYGF